MTQNAPWKGRNKVWFGWWTAAAIVALIICPTFTNFAANEKNSSDPRELAKQIVAAYQTGKREWLKQNETNNVLALEKAVKDFPADPMIHFALAESYMGQDKTGPALVSMEKAYNLSKKDPGIGMMYALALKMSKQPLKAYELDKDIADQNPNIPQLQFTAATIGITIQKYAEALPALERIEKQILRNMDPKDKSVVLLTLGTCYLYTTNHAQAILTLERALKYTPKMGTAFAVLGETYLKSGSPEKAHDCFEKALAIYPRYPVVLYYKGILLEKQGNPEKAEKCFQLAYEEGKTRLQDNGEDYFLMFLICEKLSKHDEAKTYKADAQRLLFSHEAPWKK